MPNWLEMSPWGAKCLKLTAATLVGVTMCAQFSAPGFAQDTAGQEAVQEAAEIDPDAVVATVNGLPVIEADLAFVAEAMGENLSRIPPQSLRPYLVEAVIDLKIMADAARKAELESSVEFTRRKTYLEDRALQRAYFSKLIEEKVTQEAVLKAYSTFLAENPAQDELRARHILVPSEEEALALIEELNGGKDFAELAQEKSTGPTGPNGGDLGFFGRNQMVAEFETAAYALEVGGVSAPVQTQFGWHVIKVEERREGQNPTLEELEAQLRQQLIVSELDTSIEALRGSAVIDFVDEDLAAVLAPASEDQSE